jgi:hypothetical protein
LRVAKQRNEQLTVHHQLNYVKVRLLKRNIEIVPDQKIENKKWLKSYLQCLLHYIAYKEAIAKVLFPAKQANKTNLLNTCIR